MLQLPAAQNHARASPVAVELARSNAVVEERRSFQSKAGETEGVVGLQFPPRWPVLCNPL
jgi:hypothetical protein